MDCNKCKKNLRDCDCSDIDKRMTDLRNNPNFIYKMCAICEKHYERCECENPVWTTSHDGVSLEETLSQPTLGDKMREAKNPKANVAKLFKQTLTEGGKAIPEDMPEDMPEELKIALDHLTKLGVKIQVLKGDPKLLNQTTEEQNASVLDVMDFKAYQESGGKIN